MATKLATNGAGLVYRLILRAQSSEVDATSRLKQLLKLALRRFNFKCLRIERMNEVDKE